MLFDTHVHLNDSCYENYDQIIQEAIKNNVKKMVVIGYDLTSSKMAVKIANEYPFIFASIGIHPSEANGEYSNDLIELEKLISNKVVSIGEIGLDYHYEGYDKNKQKELFISQLKLAKKYNTITRFLEKNKNVVYEAGAINKLITNVEYEKGKNNFLDDTEDYIILTLDNNKKYG